ncbi:MAG: hypothetical protein JJU37_12055 [Balneolaceae bacterium]|nr:hypothetical protein [Balneolaceae bacterium]
MSLNFNKYRSRYISFIFVILLLALMLSRVFRPSAQSTPEISISYSEAAGHAGVFAEVCGDVASVTYIQNIGGKPTFINFGAHHPNQEFTVVIWGENLSRWRTAPSDLYSERFICVRGRINIHDGTPQIVATGSDQISFNPRYR